jgi:hypothetical protein
LANSIQPGKLELGIICDCADLETAEVIVQPLLTFPALSGCAIRLALIPNKELQALAKDTMGRLLQRTPSPPVDVQLFRFLDLPKEIQLNILGWTNLVCSEISCSTLGGLHYPGSCQAQGRIAETTEYPATDAQFLVAFAVQHTLHTTIAAAVKD